VGPVGAPSPGRHSRAGIGSQHAECLRAGGRIIEGQPAGPALVRLTGESGHIHIAMMTRQPALRGPGAWIARRMPGRQKGKNAIGGSCSVTPEALAIVAGFVGVVLGSGKADTAV